jgi:hypothetical protein
MMTNQKMEIERKTSVDEMEMERIQNGDLVVLSFEHFCKDLENDASQ